MRKHIQNQWISLSPGSTRVLCVLTKDINSDEEENGIVKNWLTLVGFPKSNDYEAEIEQLFFQLYMHTTIRTYTRKILYFDA